MADILVSDWIEEYKSLTESEIHTYSSEQEHNHEVMIALYEVLTEPHKFKGPNLVDGICNQLLDFYRSGEKQLQKFTLQYIPVLVFLHLLDKSYSTSVQTLLVSLYNLEVTDSEGQARIISFRIPSIAQSSIYHDSSSLEPAFTAENSLRRWEECNTKLVSWGPLPPVERINAQNRQPVITALVFLYNQQLANIITQGIDYTCKGISRLVTQGFNSSGIRYTTDGYSPKISHYKARIPVSNQFLLELLHIVYHGAERGANGAVHALHDIIQRAMYETYADVLLAGNAIKNLLQNSPSISIAPRPSHSHSVSKTMITNASFRTKKLPDDIPIQDDQHQGEVALDSITEEQEGIEIEKGKSRGSVSALKHLPKLPGLGRKHKTKTNIQSDQSVEMSGSGDQNSDQTSSDLNHTVHVSVV